MKLQLQNKKIKILLFASYLFAASFAAAQTAPTSGFVYRYAGVYPNGVFTHVNGTGTLSSTFGTLDKIIFDPTGKVLYICDNSFNEIRKIVLNTGPVQVTGSNVTSEGAVSTLVFAAAGLKSPTDIVFDPRNSNIMYVADQDNFRVVAVNVMTSAIIPLFTVPDGLKVGSLAISADGTKLYSHTFQDFDIPTAGGHTYVTTLIAPQVVQGTPVVFAGNGQVGPPKDGVSAVNSPVGGNGDIQINVNGDLFATDAANDILYYINTTGTPTIHVFATSAVSSDSYTGPSIDGPLGTATFNQPYHFFVDANDNIYFADHGGNTTRFLNRATQTIKTLAGNGNVTTTTGSNSGDGGIALNATFNYPYAFAINPATGGFYDSDYGNGVIRYIHNITSLTLPVVFTAFSAIAQGNTALLNWSTATESNSKSFTIQRSVNGSSFDSIGNVVSLSKDGNSTESLLYKFIDASPAAGNNYYRLKQIDKDGAFQFSETEKVTFQTTNTTVKLSPNPTHSLLNIAGSAIGSKFKILDLSGKLVLPITNSIIINVADLANGVYMLKIESGTSSEIIKFIKQ